MSRIESTVQALSELTVKPSTPPPPGLLEENFLHSINFETHVRTQFRSSPTDRTGDLVRLLEDIGTVTRSISSYLISNNDIPTSSTKEVALQRLYASLSHDGYACIILERNRDAPLTFDESALNGGYVVMLTALDGDPASHIFCATSFSVYRRRSSTSLPGRLKDLQQKIVDQVAAGYVMYASATTLHYSIGSGVFSFSLHPVARRYFVFQRDENDFQGENHLFGPHNKLTQTSLGKAAIQIARCTGATSFDSGSLFSDFHAAMFQGGALVWPDVHLLCEAAPLAYLGEQMGAKATNGAGVRILGKCSSIPYSDRF